MGLFSKSPEEKKLKFIKKALSSSNSGNHFKAIQEYKKALEIDPDDPELLKSIALEYSCMNNYRETYEYLDKYTTITNDKEMLEFKFSTAVIMEDNEKIIKTTDELFVFEPENIDYWYNRGLSFMALKNYNEAKKCGEAIRNIDSKNPQAYKLLGWGDQGLGNIEESKEHFCKLLEIENNDAETIKRIANDYQLDEEYETALYFYEKGIESNPNDDELWTKKSYMCFILKDYDESIKCLDKVMEIKPEYTLDMLITKGNVYIDKEEYENAIECYDKALAINPNDFDAWKMKGKCSMELCFAAEDGSVEQDNYHNAALTYFEKASSINPYDIELLNDKAFIYGRMGNCQMAIMTFEQVLSIDENNMFAWYWMGKNYDLIGDHVQAEQCRNIARSIDPELYIQLTQM
ncbi:hypothetical protein TL18_08225 [Methanobrevibacter sp. YE315]|uniref:tetratricopeptide repeat protein n=1 Tax=Methanobrevibacter sp. YE315 TaxID=1609968 RepID=UPI000764D0B6|nr:tetratricopeptide repeat protein [Methanobrevibacter sp. YE315]AMD18015.1 hypothetical protein TL18_08225 [Methanobrevibacter sp. YE315]